MNFRIHKIEKTENQQDTEFNPISSTPYYKPAVLPVYIIDSENKNEYVRNSHWFDPSIDPNQWHWDEMRQFQCSGYINPCRIESYTVQINMSKIIDISTEYRNHTVHQQNNWKCRTKEEILFHKAKISWWRESPFTFVYQQLWNRYENYILCVWTAF